MALTATTTMIHHHDHGHVHGPHCNHGHQEPVRNALKDVGRNDPCPCGSEKKFKEVPRRLIDWLD
jgi:uncharacterized protein YecA (UPF0149 family)